MNIDRDPVDSGCGDGLQWWMTARPVSYTHLDVYKRQARDISDRIIFMDDGLIAVEGTPEEVFSSDHVRMKEFLGKFHQGLA